MRVPAHEEVLCNINTVALWMLFLSLCNGVCVLVLVVLLILSRMSLPKVDELIVCWQKEPQLEAFEIHLQYVTERCLQQ